MAGAFVFPAAMAAGQARDAVAAAYAKVNAGKVVRRTTKRARAEGLDPPFDIGYVAEPDVATFPEGLGVALNSDILLYEEFPGWRRCLAIFEEEVGDALMHRVHKEVRRWLKRHPQGI